MIVGDHHVQVREVEFVVSGDHRRYAPHGAGEGRGHVHGPGQNQPVNLALGEGLHRAFAESLLGPDAAHEHEIPVAVQDAGQPRQELSVPWPPDVVAEHPDDLLWLRVRFLTAVFGR